MWHRQSGYIETCGHRAHVVDTGGPLPPLVLVHGIFVSSWAWRHNVEALSKHFRVVAICQKGHGWSDKPSGAYGLADLAGFICGALDTLGISACHMVGNSLGGAVALWLAVHRPERIRRLILVDPAAVRFDSLGGLLRLQGPALAPLYKLVGRPVVFQQLLRAMVYKRLPIDGAYMEKFMEPLKTPGAVEAVASVSRSLGPDVADLFERLPDVSHPIQIIWGAHDKLVPLKAGFILNRRLPSSRLRVFPHCGHCPMEEDPAEFNQFALAFLREA